MVVVVCGASAVHLQCICSASAVRLRIIVVVEDVVVCGAPTVRPRYPCGTPAAPLLRAYGIIVVCSVIAVDWLR